MTTPERENVMALESALQASEAQCKELIQALNRAYEEQAQLKEALRWYVENDDTNEGGKWEESNARWLKGKRRAMKLLGIGV